MLGEHDLTKADGEKKVRVCSTTLHPRYNRKRIDNDFAILRLCSPVSFSRDVSTVCLPSSSSNNYDNVQVSPRQTDRQTVCKGVSRPSSRDGGS